MEMPIEVIKAVAPSLEPKVKKPRKKYAKRGKLQTKVLNALGNGLRTTESISHAVGDTRLAVARLLWKLTQKGMVITKKVKGVREAKYYLNTEKPHLDLRTLPMTGTKKEMQELALKLSQGRQVRMSRPPIRMNTVAIGISDTPLAGKLRTAADNVNHPAHYKTGGIETIDFIEAKQLTYNLGNVVKYITRADHKGNKLEDLKKAQWYLNREIQNLSK